MLKKNIFILVILISVSISGRTFGMDKGGEKEDTVALPGIEKDIWGRNPFLTKVEIASLQGEKSPQTIHQIAIPESWEVKTILITDSSRLATINGQIVTIGDLVGGKRVLEINEDSVILGKDEKEWVVKPPQPFIHIEVKE